MSIDDIESLENEMNSFTQERWQAAKEWLNEISADTEENQMRRWRFALGSCGWGTRRLTSELKERILRSTESASWPIVVSIRLSHHRLVDIERIDMRGLLVARSRIPNAGQGVFAYVPFEEGDELGAYPGVVRSLEEMRQLYSQELIDLKFQYTIEFTGKNGENKYVVDPTDNYGVPKDNWLEETYLPLINEPRKMSECNVECVETDYDSEGDPLEVSEDKREDIELVPVFVVTKLIEPLHEIYWFYGDEYPRHGWDVIRNI